MIKIAVVRNCNRYRTCYDCIAFVVANGMMIGWLFYGYDMFYSD